MVYLSLLEDELWSVTALDSIKVCSGTWTTAKWNKLCLRKMPYKWSSSSMLPRTKSISARTGAFLKIITKSSRINNSCCQWINAIARL
ncbi:hypothetical protein HAX54_031745 [Datura stramonium]|uniref:Uncharacterized protein n=1 Tax=Datura stramonium TaxID=4076 RepID=A0ABS8SC70_DATST|nr:hypothetical protein [Datura stramonium]